MTMLSDDDVLRLKRVEIVDDGSGFDPGSDGRGAGLQNMEDRVAAIGGDMAVHSAPGAGTTVTASLPVAAAVLAL